MDNKRYIWIVVTVLLFFIGVVFGYLYFVGLFKKEVTKNKENSNIYTEVEEIMTLRMYYPVGKKLILEQRNVPRRRLQTSIAEATIEEYFKESIKDNGTIIPKEVEILGIYNGIDGILYVDLSDELRRNFQGDALDEFLLLKGLYESIISNVEDIKDIKILIEGKEIETIGGHFYCLYPLKEVFSIDLE
jgi:uncharacterized protein YneF (UPF0154 family)